MSRQEAWDVCEAQPCSLGASIYDRDVKVANVPGGYGRRATKRGRQYAAQISAVPLMIEVLQALVESFDANGEFNSYTAEHSPGELRSLAEKALAVAGATR